MGLDIDMRLDLEDVIDGFESMKRRGRNLSAVWRELEPIAKRDQTEHARLQEGPDGPWQPLDSSTRARRLQSKRRTARSKGRRRPKRVGRRLLGRLPRLVRVAFNRDTFLVRSKVPWSGAHQDGAAVGRGARVPQRQHVYFSKQFLDRIADAVAERLRRAF